MHVDPELQAVLTQTWCQLDRVLSDSDCFLVEAVPLESGLRLRMFGVLLSTHLRTSVNDTQFGYREELYNGDQVLCEFAIYPPMYKTVSSVPYIAEIEVPVFQTSAKSAIRKLSLIHI